MKEPMLILLVILGIACLVSSSTSSTSGLAEEILAAMNRSADPCESFYEFTCGGWMDSHTLPPDADILVRAFKQIGDRNLQADLTIVTNPQYTKLNTWYLACMNVSATESLGISPLRPILAQIDRFMSGGFLSSFMYTVGYLQSLGVGNALLGFGADIDAENPSVNIAQMSQGGYAIPARSVYLGQDKDLMAQYLAHINRMFELAGDNTASDGKSALLVETTLARISLPQDELIDPFSLYNKLDLAGLQALTPQIPWSAFFEGMGFPKITQINVITPAFFSALNEALPQMDISLLGAYLKWEVIHAFAQYLSPEFVMEDFNFFGRILEGQQEMQPRNETCVSSVDGALGDLLGKYYVDLMFPGESKDVAEQMVMNIEAAMQQSIINIDWMDNVTRSKALEKLSLVDNLMGYPNNPLTYGNLSVLPNQYFANTLLSWMLQFITTASSIGQPSQRDKWSMVPDEINAYYDPTRNQMVFPAGILQSPYFNGSYPLVLNYAGAGSIMGHELTHGFDNQGKDYNGHGKLVNWWKNVTDAAFQARADCVIAQYSKYEVIPGVYVNGNITQGENIADMGGTKNSYHALEKILGSDMQAPSIVPGFTNQQLFFIQWAQNWCSVASPQYLKQEVETDPHSPAPIRAVGPLVNLPQFAEAFSCPVGSFMNPTNRCEVW